MSKEREPFDFGLHPDEWVSGQIERETSMQDQRGDCPLVAELIDLVKDRLDDQSAARLNTHLQKCSECKRRYDALHEVAKELAAQPVLAKDDSLLYTPAWVESHAAQPATNALAVLDAVFASLLAYGRGLLKVRYLVELAMAVALVALVLWGVRPSGDSKKPPPIDGPVAGADLPVEDHAAAEVQTRDVDQQWGLIVGASYFEGGKKRIFAREDAERFAEFLLQGAKLHPDHVKVLTDQQATREGIRDALRWLAKSASEDATVFLYLACFGRRENNHLFFSSFDGGYPADELLLELMNVPARTKFGVIDCCFAGEGGLDEVVPRLSRPENLPIILTSCSRNQKSWNDPDGRASYFNRYLMDALKGNADEDLDGKLTAAEILRYVRNRLQEEPLSGPQEPRLYADHLLYSNPVLFDIGEREIAYTLTLNGLDFSEAVVEVLEPDETDGQPVRSARGVKVARHENAEFVLTGFRPSRDYRVAVAIRGNRWEKDVQFSSKEPHKRFPVDVLAPQHQPGEVEIRITKITSKITTERPPEIAGTVSGLDDESKYDVICFVRSDLFYPHPYPHSRAAIRNGEWSIRHIRRGYEELVAAVVVEKGTLVPAFVADLDILQPKASTAVEYQPEYSAD